MQNNMSILDKVNFILQTAAEKECSKSNLDKIIALSSEDSNEYVLGRVMGYSVSDYAIAALCWINSNDSMNAFNNIFIGLSSERKNRIHCLVKNNYHLEYA